MEGIAEFDRQGRFGFAADNIGIARKEAEWYGRPEYASSLCIPDGIEREKARYARGLEVVRSNPGWFFSTMLRRMAFMLSYNDFGPQNLSSISSVPNVSANPGFDHRQQAGCSLEVSELESSNSENSDLLYMPFTVKKNTDYLIALQLQKAQEHLLAKIGTADPRIILQSTVIPESGRRSKKRKHAMGYDQEEALPCVQIPFATDGNTEVRLFFSDTAGSIQPIIDIKKIKLFELGPTPNLWTRYPRSIIRGLQRNLFQTRNMRLLIVFGAILLILARRKLILLLPLVVPLYYILSHAAFSTEYRYILPIHYFLFIIAAVTLYIVVSALWRVLHKGTASDSIENEITRP
jgi:hypothetical protein